MSSLLDLPMLPFDGKTFEASKDHSRLKSEYERIIDLCKDGEWRSLSRIRMATGFPESAIGARLRDTRKPKFHCLYTMESKRVAGGLWLYRLVPKPISSSDRAGVET